LNLRELLAPRVPPASAPTAVRRRSGIHYSFLEGAWAQIFISLTGGKFLTDLLRFFGANDQWLGFGSAVQPITSTMQILGAYLSNWAGERKRVIVPACVVARQSWWLVLPLILLDLPSSIKLPVFLALFTTSMVADAIIANLWLSWTADLIPDKVRGRILGKRTALMLTIALGADFLISEMRGRTDHQGHAPYLLACFGTAAAAGLVTAFLFRRQWEPPMKRHPVPPLREVFRDALASDGVMRLLTARCAWNIAVGIAMAFWTPFMMDYLDLTFTQILWYNLIVQGMTVFLGALVWGPVIDRAGTVPVVLICGLVIGLMPFLWLFMGPEDLAFYWLDAVLTGLCWSGFNAAMGILPLQVVPTFRRDYQLAMLSAIGGIVLGLGSVAGGTIAQALHGIEIHWNGREYGNYHVMFVISGLLRLSCLFVLARVPDVRSKGIMFALLATGTSMKEMVTNPMLLFARRNTRRR